MQQWLTAIPALRALVEEASSVILPHFSTQVAFEEKSDGSPVTLADKAADACIRAGLLQISSHIPVLSEETSDEIDVTTRLSWSQLWLVDPLDGTRQFIRGDSGFSINIALIDQHRPIVGVVYSPVEKVGYWAIKGYGAWRWHGDDVAEPIRVGNRQTPIRVITGYSQQKRGAMTESFLASLGDYALSYLGSALKMCKVADGSADVYPRFGQTSEWDTAAGQIIVEEAGGYLQNLQGEPLTYNLRESLENPPFIVWGQLGPV